MCKKFYIYIQLVPLYAIIRPITKEKYKDMIDLLSYTPSIYQEYFKVLKTEEKLRKDKKKTLIN